MKELCENCKKHEATINWVGVGSILDFSHGNYDLWCKCCALKAQIKDAKRQIKSLKKLKVELLKIKCKKV